MPLHSVWAFIDCYRARFNCSRYLLHYILPSIYKCSAFSFYTSHLTSLLSNSKGKGEYIPEQAWIDTESSMRLRLAGISGNRYKNVAKLLVLITGRLYPRGRTLVLIFVRCLVGHRNLVWPEGLSQ